MNKDAQEVAKFDQLARDWWNEDTAHSTLHHINPIRLDYIAQRCHLTGSRVVDIGCGGGILSESMAAAGAEVTGIDASTAMITVAEQHRSLDHNKDLRLNYLTTTAEEFAAQHPGEFDTVTCLELLEHVPDPANTVAACAQLLRPGGNLFFATVNRNPKAYLLAIVGAEYVLGLLPRQTHDYQRFIKPAELAAWVRAAACSVIDIAGMQYNPFNKRARLNADTSVNYLLHARAP